MAIFNYTCRFMHGEPYKGFPCKLEIECLNKGLDLDTYMGEVTDGVNAYKQAVTSFKLKVISAQEFRREWSEYINYFRNINKSIEIVNNLYKRLEGNEYFSEAVDIVRDLQHQFCFIYRVSNFLDVSGIYLYVYIDYYCYMLGVHKSEEFDTVIDEALGLTDPTNLGYNIAKLGVSALKFGATLDPMKLSDVSESALNVYDTSKQVINSFRKKKGD